MMSGVQVEAPCDGYGGASGPVSYDGTEYDQGNNEYLVEAAWQPWMCNVNEASGTWKAQFGLGEINACTEWTLNRVNYVVPDGATASSAY